ncbi:YlxR family protein [Citricoccus nitrophenolicus]|uniref:YlxR family protein n=1 Tax=Citricoccus nitrophenolicus TaxID=863575 RepID=A0ABV0IGG4_9MICC|nr:YlxR family protein [Citricoccus sp. I39-566]WMY76871.1 YlxR family protein [Citricoccus sp. I39-566]
MQAHTPVRTCIGCRGKDDHTQLVRLVLDGVTGSRSVVPDWRRRMPGRGAWLHPDDACLQAALKRGAFNRAFRGRVDATSLAGLLAARPGAPAPKNDNESGSEI